MAFSNIGSAEGVVTAVSSTSDTTSVTVPNLAADCVGILIAQSSIAGRTLGTATWNGSAMTAAGAEVANGNLRTRIYYLVGAADNGTYDVVINYDGGTAATHSAHHTIVWADSTAAISLDDYDTTSGTTQNPTITTTPTQGNDLVVSGCYSLANDLGTPVTDKTDLQSHDFGGSCVSSAYSQPTGSGNCTHTHNFTQSDVYVIAAAAFKDAAVANNAPTIAQNTADATTFTSLTPTLEFTGSDADSDDLQYEIQISDHPSDFTTSGSTLISSFTTGGGGLSVHPQHAGAGNAWDGNPQMDDRPGQSFTGAGGVIDKFTFYMQADAPNAPTGTAVIRVYDHQGTYGTSSAPLNAATRANTPTPDWIAESDSVALTGLAAGLTATDFSFTGAERARLVNGTRYVAVLNYHPDSTSSTNTMAVAGDASGTGALFDGNGYNDGAGAGGVNNGPQSTWDFYHRSYETYTLLDKTSGTDAGFSNTVTPADTSPFTAGQKVSYTLQTSLGDGGTYHWRVRVRDPLGTNVWSSWTASRSFTINLPDAPAGGSKPSQHAIWFDPSFFS